MPGKDCIYLDYNATTPVLPEVKEVFSFYACEEFGNPSSAHRFGKRAKEALEFFRSKLSELLSADSEGVIFTSGGTEANHLALFGVISQYKRAHLLVSSFEHPSVLLPAAKLLEMGYEVDFIPVTSEGYIDPDEVKKRIKPHTKLVSIMLANNEIGTIQPLREIAKICKERDIFIHTDACQAIGKIPVSFEELKVDLLSLAGHKVYAPKGIGALIVKKGIKLEPLFLGGGQERGIRAGTEPLALIASLTKACEIAITNLEGEKERLIFLREKLYEGLKEIYPRLYRYGIPEKTLPNTLTVSFVGLKGWEILDSLPEICASTGSACHDRKTSNTLLALKVSNEVAQGTIRFSLGKYTTLEDINKALTLFQSYFSK
ncbi:MAG: cysteine desulfurase family protein [Caldimicrobium sp.]